MEYGSVHRLFLRTIASLGTMTIPEAKESIDKFAGDEYPDQDLSVHDIVRDINKEIKPFHQNIKIAIDEYTNKETLVFVSTICNAATKSQNLFGKNELEYFKLLMDHMMEAATRQISGINALNLVNKIKPKLTKTRAQKLLDMWCQMRYYDKVGDNYALGVRVIHEFDGYFREHMPDLVEDCCLCKQAVFRGYNCPECLLAVHTRCFNKYTEKIKKWPCCKIEFREEQLDELLKEDSLRLTETDTQPEAEVTVQNEQEAECTQPEEDLAVPGTSQQDPRKKNRTPENALQSDSDDSQ